MTRSHVTATWIRVRVARERGVCTCIMSRKRYNGGSFRKERDEAIQAWKNVMRSTVMDLCKAALAGDYTEAGRRIEACMSACLLLTVTMGAEVVATEAQMGTEELDMDGKQAVKRGFKVAERVLGPVFSPSLLRKLAADIQSGKGLSGWNMRSIMSDDTTLRKEVGGFDNKVEGLDSMEFEEEDFEG